MTDQPSEAASTYDYKERQIVLSPIQHEDGTWVCQFVIIESGQNTAKVQQTFPSREAAELAALQTAKSLIDLR